MSRDLGAVLRAERDRFSLLLEVTNLLVKRLDLGELLEALSGCLQRTVRHDYASVTLFEPGTLSHGLVRLVVLDGRRRADLENRSIPIVGVPGADVLPGQPTLSDIDEMRRQNPTVGDILGPLGLQKFCPVHLHTARGSMGLLSIATRDPDGFTADEVTLLTQVAAQVAIAVDNGFAYEEIRRLRDRLAAEKSYLEDDIRTEHDFTDLIGQSAALLDVLRQVATVAATGATVLLTGETGTGKELIARAIHDRSDRRGKSFVRVNCAAIPGTLIESEMFGQERGAFTGALAARAGRFEIADGGTLFLDEVGDLPLEVQPKLLRVLQEHEFERLGSTRTTRVDVRVIAATNRDLPVMAASGEFRPDLFYRLNVFPIRLPALRERREDIPALVRYFVNRYSRRLKRTITVVPASVIDALSAWDWPGNIRELENVIERATILSSDGVLRASLGDEARAPSRASSNSGRRTRRDGTLDELQRDAIVAALRATEGRLSGPNGAAVRLGVKRTTLQSRMLKLGIVPKSRF